LYFYVKKNNMGIIGGLREYVEMFTSDKASGPEGYLTDKGLIPLGDVERSKRSKAIKTLENLVM